MTPHWNRILGAARGRRNDVIWAMTHGDPTDVAFFLAFVVADPSPSPQATLAAITLATRRHDAMAALLPAALAPPLRRALAAWRRTPTPSASGVDADLWRAMTWGVADAVRTIRRDDVALRYAVAIVLRHAEDRVSGACLEALDAAGWRALTETQRNALFERVATRMPFAFGTVWSALGDGRRAAIIRQAARSPVVAARLIGRIGAAAWRAMDAETRRLLCKRVIADAVWVPETAPAWNGMTDAEIARLADAVIALRDGRSAQRTLECAGADGRKRLSAPQRAALDAQAALHAPVRVLLMRAADNGWNGLSDQERDQALCAIDDPRNAAALVRAVGAPGWAMMNDEERARVRRGMSRTDLVLACPPDLWTILAPDGLPPISLRPTIDPNLWSADADLGMAPADYRTMVVALAPWRTGDIDGTTDRIQRVLATWSEMTDRERHDLALAMPWVAPAVAAAARLQQNHHVLDGVMDLLIRRAAQETDNRDDIAILLTSRLRRFDLWRDVMDDAVPTDITSPEAWSAWNVAVQRGWVVNDNVCALLAAESHRRRMRQGRRCARTPRFP